MVLLFALAVFYQLAVLTLADSRTLVFIIPDDAAYYLKIAEHVALGNGFTFDGVNQTNGFQPLWLYVLVALYSIYPGPPEIMLRVTLFVQLVCLVISAVLLNSFMSRHVSSITRWVSLAVFLSMVFVTSINGMESALLILLLSLLHFYGWRARVFQEHGIWRAAGFGALLGLVMLCRLDLGLLGVAVYAFCLLRIAVERRNWREHAVRLAVIFIASSLVLAPYLIHNQMVFGSVSPISVQLKSTFPRVEMDLIVERPQLRYGGIWLASVLYLVYSLSTVKRLNTLGSYARYHRISMMIMAAVVAVHFLHSILFIKWGLGYWHFTPYGLFACLAIAEPVEHLCSRRWFARYAAALPVALLAFVLLGARRAHARLDERRTTTDGGPGPSAAGYEAARWVREHTQEEDRFALKDCGHFGLLSRRSVVNLDGLVNNMEYQEALRARRLEQYLKDKQVRYLVGHLFIGRDDVVAGTYETYSRSYLSHKYEVRSDEITVRREDEIYRSPPFYDGIYRTVFIIWALDRSS